ncbi:MAG: serine/threonine-protein kinase [Planctomycetota bacterium]
MKHHDSGVLPFLLPSESELHDLLDSPLPLGAPESGRRYKAERVLAEGGFGVVSLCREVMVGRMVAVKKLRRELLGDRRMVNLLAREARILSMLEGIPGVLPLYDLDRDDWGCPFLVTKWIDGPDLFQIVRGRSKTAYRVPQQLSILADIAETLSVVHQAGLVHQDIKPENMMIDHDGRSYLVDWGSARWLSDRLNESSQAYTSERRQFIGSPMYASPETIQSKEIAATSDIYSIGSVLYEVLTGIPMIRGGSFHNSVELALRGGHTRPSLQSPEREIPQIADELWEQCTEINPDDRPQETQFIALRLRQIAGEIERQSNHRDSQSVANSTPAAISMSGSQHLEYSTT